MLQFHDNREFFDIKSVGKLVGQNYISDEILTDILQYLQ